MSIKVLQQSRQHPARDASIRSITCIENKDREGWLALWHAEGVIEDPVGPSPLDPEGGGHRGIAAITAFYDNVITTSTMRFHIRQSFACGNECANVGTITGRTVDGMTTRCELVMVYRVDDEGNIVSLRAFWEFDDLVEDVF
jgi:steroid delta-isomerase